MPTIKELKAEIKSKGIKGITGKNKTQLLAMLQGDSNISNTSKTVAELKAELKAMKVKGITGKNKKQLIAMYDNHMGEKGNKDKENDAFFEDAYKQLNKTSKPTNNLGINKKNNIPKNINSNMQEKLAKQGLRGGLKKKYKV